MPAKYHPCADGQERRNVLVRVSLTRKDINKLKLIADKQGNDWKHMIQSWADLGVEGVLDEYDKEGNERK